MIPPQARNPSGETLGEYIVEEALPRGFSKDPTHALAPDRSICCASCGHKNADGLGIAQGLLATEVRLYVVHGCRSCGARWIAPPRDKSTKVAFKGMRISD